jgi:hypothetical protein
MRSLGFGAARPVLALCTHHGIHSLPFCALMHLQGLLLLPLSICLSTVVCFFGQFLLSGGSCDSSPQEAQE